MKKFLVQTLSTALVGVLFLSLASCNRQSTTPPAAASPSTGSQVSGPKLELPLANGDVTFSLLLAGIGNLVSSFDYADNAFTKRIVDETGIKLDIIGVSDTDYKARLNVLLGSGDYPDLIISRYSDVTLNDLIYFGNEGIFISMDQFNPLAYPNIKAAFEEYPAAYDRVRGADGKLYSLPTVNDCLHCRFRGGRAVYYMPWIRDNGRTPPQTTDDLLEYLRWVKANDVNKNGNRNDEIPVAFCRDDIKTAISYIAKAYMPFVNTDQYFGLGLVDGKVTEQYKADEFREALKYLANLYKEGLILPDSFTMARQQLRALGGADPAPVLAYAFTNSQGDASSTGTQRWIETFIAPVLKGPAGQQNGPNKDPWSIINPGLIITDKCKNPELAVAWYNYLLNFDVSMDGYIGPKGQCWDEPDAGTTSLMGGAPKYKLLIGYGTQPVNAGWNQYNPMIRNNDFRLGEQAKGADAARQWLSTGDPSLLSQLVDNASYNEEQNYFNTVDQFPYEMPAGYFIPPIAMDETDTARLADINANLETFKEQACVEFIAGSRDINNDAVWNTYLSELDRMGSGEMASLIQKYLK
ncbi:MAG: extracellular solute-binding protein [Treponema sp.]|jgi:putative aldouronate transport system substrate-binding protein|nr:extracellular solute-binding protein [Treponema sp.]